MSIVDDYGAHVNSCERCIPHRGHVPFGLCPTGRTLFFSQRWEEPEPENRGDATCGCAANPECDGVACVCRCHVSAGGGVP